MSLFYLIPENEVHAKSKCFTVLDTNLKLLSLPVTYMLVLNEDNWKLQLSIEYSGVGELMQ